MALADEVQVQGGFLLAQDPLWGVYLNSRLLRLRRAAAGLAQAKDPAVAARREQLLQVIDALEKKKGEWERANHT